MMMMKYIYIYQAPLTDMSAVLFLYVRQSFRRLRRSEYRFVGQSVGSEGNRFVHPKNLTTFASTNDKVGLSTGNIM